MKIKEVMFYILVVITLIVISIFIISGVYMNLKAEELCNKKCLERGALTNEVHKSGNYKIDDTCICIYKDKIEAFKLG